MKTITANSSKKDESDKVNTGRSMQQQLIGLINHYNGTQCNEEVAVNKKTGKIPGETHW